MAGIPIGAFLLLEERLQALQVRFSLAGDDGDERLRILEEVGRLRRDAEKYVHCDSAGADAGNGDGRPILPTES